MEVRGVYYKETSNRVVQPRVDLQATDPGSQITVTGYYLLDAITSASIAQGNVTDAVRTEYRNEAGLSVGRPVHGGQLSAGLRHSRESDYQSVGGNLGYSHDFAEKNFTLSGSFAHNFDWVGNRFAGTAGTLSSSTTSLYATQLLSPTAVLQLGYELQYQQGLQSNQYRFVDVSGGPMPERHPVQRDRHTFAGRIAQLYPSTGTGLQLLYRYYVDGWDVRSHTIEPRIYQDLGDSVQLRLGFRYYTQTRAYFFRDLMAGERNPLCDFAADPDRRCAYTGDDKLRPQSSTAIDLSARFSLQGWQRVPGLGWFSAGAIDVSYTSFRQDNTWGRCGPGTKEICEDRVIQVGYAMPL